MSSPPPVVATPGSNVTPMWGGAWPGRPPASPPSCFSQLYGLNQCYDDIIMMQQILQKVICDMAANNPAFQKCLAEGVAAVGAGSPLTGVVDGSTAAPGIVGEYVEMVQQPTYPATTINTQPVTMGVLQPGDWQCWASFSPFNFGGGNYFLLNPEPTGFSTNMLGESLDAAAGLTAYATIGITSRASLSVPTLVVFSLTTNYSSNASAASTTGTMLFQARRMR